MATTTLPAQQTAVALGIAFVVDCAVAEGYSSKRVAEIELAVEEALVNICRYAYPYRTGDVEVRCTRDEAQQCVIEMIDTGEPFNLLTLPPPELTADLAQRPVGGLGVWLIRALVDDVAYRREGNCNILQLVIHPPG